MPHKNQEGMKKNWKIHWNVVPQYYVSAYILGERVYCVNELHSHAFSKRKKILADLNVNMRKKKKINTHTYT